MRAVFFFALAGSAFLGALFLWVGEGAITRFPRKHPWWYVNPFWWPRRYEKALGRIGAVGVACAGMALCASGIIAMVD